jgi:hypothetical protein
MERRETQRWNEREQRSEESESPIVEGTLVLLAVFKTG